MKVALPWPHRNLSPNARVHFRVKSGHAKQAREDAGFAACGQLSVLQRRQVAERDGPIRLTVTFCPPDARRRDMDNMLAAAKSTLDGLADALRVDDHRFELTLRRGDPVKLGAIEVWIEGVSHA